MGRKKAGIEDKEEMTPEFQEEAKDHGEVAVQDRQEECIESLDTTIHAEVDQEDQAQEYIEKQAVFYIGPAVADLVPFRFYKDIPYTGKRLIEKNSRYKRLFIDHAITDNKLREMLNNNITFRDIYNQALKEGV